MRFVISGTTESGPYIDVPSLMFRPSTEDLVYVATEGLMSVVVDAGRRGEAYNLISQLGFSPRRKVPIYRVRSEDQADGKEFVIMGSRKLGPYDYVGRIQVLQDEGSIMFGVIRDREMLWVTAKEK